MQSLLKPKLLPSTLLFILADIDHRVSETNAKSIKEKLTMAFHERRSTCDTFTIYHRGS